MKDIEEIMSDIDKTGYKNNPLRIDYENDVRGLKK